MVYSLGSCIDSLDDSLIRGVDMNRAKDITIVLLFIAVVYLVATRDWSNDVPEVSQSPDVSIAVLPFVNMSTEAGNEYFSEGISDEIISALATVNELKVADCTSSFEFKGRTKDLRAISEALGVSHIVEGAASRTGARVKITPQLIRVDNGMHFWSQTYDRTGYASESIPSEIAGAIARVIGY